MMNKEFFRIICTYIFIKDVNSFDLNLVFKIHMLEIINSLHHCPTINMVPGPPNFVEITIE